ncbi:MAG TPA: M20/M25/M40 family metallo-hydrolase, partial [Phycisphaerae bacterium]|nr:M20/M25/M40 family metallo-hydrolase [Phycisphaerae bacterium]
MKLRSRIPANACFGLILTASAPSIHAITPDRYAAVDVQIDKSLPAWLTFYRSLHANPELSRQEKETARRMADALDKLGLRVTTGIGGHGVVAIVENGEGPVVLVRADMDALPITEETGLSYASKVVQAQADGTSVGVMHACGHDVHMATLIGTAQTLLSMKEAWRGTVLFVAQPAEETGQGAR